MTATDTSIAAASEPSSAPAWRVMAALGLGYVGVYLCRKNLAVAVPLLQDALGASKEQVGRIASAGTFAYAIGKLMNGLIVDHLGGRRGYLLSLAAVAVFGAAGALAPGIGALMIVYGLNRFAGSAAWGAMVKLVPTWFGTARTATAMGILSLSYVAGGVAATLLARQIVRVRRRLALRHGASVAGARCRGDGLRAVRARRQCRPTVGPDADGVHPTWPAVGALLHARGFSSHAP